MNLLTPTSPSPSSNTNNGDPKPDLPNPNNGETPDTHDPTPLFEDFESACSTPYVSAPSSPGRSPSSAGGGFFYSAPASPMHFVLTSNHSASSSSSYSAATDAASSSSSFGFEFEFSARFGPAGSGSTRTMSSADELFLNGKIRPMKLSTHLEKPQNLAPLLDLDPENDNDNEEEEVGLSFEAVRGRDLRLRDKSLRRRTRSMSPLRSSGSPFELNEPTKMASESKQNKKTQEEAEEEEEEEEPSVSASSSRSSSAGRNSKRWLFLKEFLRSKSEGRSNNKYFWSRSTISFSQTKEKKPINSGSSNTNNSNSNNPSTSGNEASSDAPKAKRSGGGAAKKPPPVNGVGKKKTYELHYTANRAQAEEMRKKTYLPYRQGLLGCLGFSSKGYGAVNGLARALNPVSSR